MGEQGSGFGVRGSGFNLQVLSSRFRVSGFGLKVQSLTRNSKLETRKVLR